MSINSNLTLLPQKQGTIIPAVHKHGLVILQITLTKREAEGIQTFGSTEANEYQKEGFKRALSKLQRTIGEQL
tara:strand:+ start:382 stop:600 length:219 start_codon:yes stop_codon:yes gene_type:complete